jgi:hypothetical protein
MSKLETPLTHWYWRQPGGLLIEESPLVALAEELGPQIANELRAQTKTH